MPDRIDPRIGLHGQYEPEVCAATGEPVNGRHHTTIVLRDGYYFRVLAKARADKAALRDYLMALLPKSGKRSVKVDEDNEASSVSD